MTKKKIIEAFKNDPVINWKAFYQEFARRGGLCKSKKKTAAARENGKKGGRPRGKTKVKK